MIVYVSLDSHRYDIAGITLRAKRPEIPNANNAENMKSPKKR